MFGETEKQEKFEKPLNCTCIERQTKILQQQHHVEKRKQKQIIKKNIDI
jgi:hypothetical protein